MTDPVLASLTTRRAELVAEAKKAEATLNRLLEDIDHIDGAIRLYDPAYRRPKLVLRRAEHGSMVRAALSVLRQASEPLTLRNVTLGVMVELGLDTKNHNLVSANVEKVRSLLVRQMKAGVARTMNGDGPAVLWEVNR